MPGKQRQRNISVTTAEYAMLSQAKQGFEGLTRTRLSWGAWLIALSLGSLAARRLAGFKLYCETCGGEVRISLHEVLEPEEDSLARLSPSRQG